MKKIISILFSIVSITASACWYQYVDYVDYISSINGKTHTVYTQASTAENSTYNVTNNQVVDLPITVSVHLTSTSSTSGGSIISEITECILQYRVLPNGKWITVSKNDTPLGTIPKDSVSTTYLGKNNIYPLGLKAGTAIMIRLYVTDGIWQTGDINSACSDLLTTVTTAYGSVLSLPNTFSYNVGEHTYDCGGVWAPHNVATVIFSGNYRPLR